MPNLPEIPVPAPIQDFTVYKGTSFVENLRPLDAEGNPYDLTGASVKIQVISPLDGVTPLLEMSTIGGEISITEPPTFGEFVISLAPSDTAALSSGGAYDVQIKLADGTIYPPILQGKFILLKPLTQ